ncbi:MAG: peptidoglycan DD-metalloendopeptidase family protein [Dokdonella sp.]|uniref:M23 family metallopeptidase n=1 Tax=Dokdonella sp. TaxID=2291710 RepID=UPI0025C53E2B|nr:peptidoglycan DD-metalloendopeptidase family protein [Dokdonella sp.]MBZ0223415.1 peptidoglycan DD-metalloendopeptidase family protein [Dokdonella sp.]MCC7256561.1 peptidoglycan DD-metalloendopeptidase family protein [Dokdonella sp.]
MSMLAVVLLGSLASAQLPAGGGAAPLLPHDEITVEQRARIDAMLARNVIELEREERLAPAMPNFVMQGGLQWPLRAAAVIAGDPGFHGISNFVDLNSAYPNQLLDWNCGTRTYDLDDGYNHAGIDLFLWPFSWLLMDQQAVDIIAAAPGTIIGKTDGNDDRSCPDHYSADWNAVYVRHGDGSVAWYGHMKKTSLTGKPIGASVAAGEFLGKVGSAGFSSGPHLHFENHTAVSNYTILEPYHGSCNAPASLWAQQRPYYDSAINKLATHSAAPVFPDPNCPNPVAETPNYSDHFNPGNTVYFAAYYRDQRGPQVTSFSILRPNGSAFASWNFKMSDSTSDPFYSASYWYWYWNLPGNAPSGLWRFKATYEGVTRTHNFFVGDVIFADNFE